MKKQAKNNTSKGRTRTRSPAPIEQTQPVVQLYLQVARNRQQAPSIGQTPTTDGAD